MVAYWTILAVAVLGTFNGPWYFLLLGAAVLTYTAVRDHQQVQLRFAALGVPGVLEAAAYASAGRALLAAIAAYGLGVLARFIFI
jgi:hypothetical protein